MEHTIEQLVALSLEDKKYTSDLWLKLEPLCLSWASKLKNIDYDQEDLYQESYMILLKALETYERGSNIYFEAYFKFLLYRWGRNYRRKRHTLMMYEKDKENFWENLIDEEKGIDEQLIDKQQIELIRSGLETLSREEYNLLMDYYVKGLKIKEISSVYGIGYKALESKKRRALKKIKKVF